MKETETLALDASVVYKWFIKEADRDKALNIRSNIARGIGSYVIPDLLIYEVSNALRYNTNYSNEDIKIAIRTIYDMEIEIVAPVPEIHDIAVEIARLKDITIYDAYYIALAQEIGYNFVTADKRLMDKVKDLEFVIFLGDT